MWFLAGSKSLSEAAREALLDQGNTVIVPVIALLEIEHAHSRGRYHHSSADVEESLRGHARCAVLDITARMLRYYPVGMEIHDALYVCAARLLASLHPDQEVAVVTKDSQIAASGIQVIW